MYGAHNSKGKSFATDEDVLGVKPQNQYMLCGENEEKMMFLTSSNQVEKCCKGQRSSFGLVFFFFFFYSKTLLLFYKSMRFCD